jgi:L-fuconolactonase
MTAEENWLDRTVEETIEPDLPICDPHHHLWDHPNLAAYKDHRYLLDELLADTGSGHHVVSTVFVECSSMYRKDGPEEMKPVGETEFVNGVAAMSASGTYGSTRINAGIVGFADLCLGAAVKPVLEAHIAAGGGRFRGIRHAAGWDLDPKISNSHTNPSASLYLDPTFRKGFAQLAPLGLSFDAWLYHPQISELTSLARAFPDTPIVLDHFGGPLGIGPYAGKREEIFEKWKADIADLAQCPNVMAKLGGINMKINGFGWHRLESPPSSAELAITTAPYYLYMIEKFGADRCMFESNFPVDKVTCTYNILWNTFKRIAADFSPTDKADLFCGSASRFYQLAK